MTALDKLPTAQARQKVNVYLHGLADAAPPPELQQRVLLGVSIAARRSRPTHMAVWGAALLAAGLSAVAVFTAFTARDDAAIAPPMVQAGPTNAPVRWQLRALDRELQLALVRGDSENRVAALWAERHAVAAQLDSPRPAAPVRM